jgi:hypothetical protein
MGPLVNLSMHVDEQPWIILFHSIHHVMAAEEVFKENNIWCDLTPVPRNLSADCGMAIEFRPRDLPAVRSVLSDPRIQARSVHRRCREGHEDMTETMSLEKGPGDKNGGPANSSNPNGGSIRMSGQARSG